MAIKSSLTAGEEFIAEEGCNDETCLFGSSVERKHLYIRATIRVRQKTVNGVLSNYLYSTTVFGRNSIFVLSCSMPYGVKLRRREPALSGSVFGIANYSQLRRGENTKMPYERIEGFIPCLVQVRIFCRPKPCS